MMTMSSSIESGCLYSPKSPCPPFSSAKKMAKPFSRRRAKMKVVKSHMPASDPALNRSDAARAERVNQQTALVAPADELFDDLDDVRVEVKVAREFINLKVASVEFQRTQDLGEHFQIWAPKAYGEDMAGIDAWREGLDPDADPFALLDAMDRESRS